MFGLKVCNLWLGEAYLAQVWPIYWHKKQKPKMDVENQNIMWIQYALIKIRFFSFIWGFSSYSWILLKDTSSFKKLIWLILFSIKFIFLEIGLVEKLNIIFLPKWFVVIPSFDIWRGNNALIKGVPRIT